MKTFFRRFKIIDGLLILGAVASFSLYIYQAFKADQKSVSGQKVGELIQGASERKMLGNVTFSTITPRAAIFNRDVLWVKEGPWIKILFQDQSVLQVKEGTLLVISKSLRSGDMGSRIELIQGELSFEKHWVWPWLQDDYEFYSKGKKVISAHDEQKHVELKSSSEPEKPGTAPAPLGEQLDVPSPSPTPLLSPSASSSPEAMASHTPGPSTGPLPDLPIVKGVHPKPGSILLKAGKSAEVLFSWPGVLSGTLEITSQNPPKSITLLNNSSMRVLLGADQTYTWIVKDQNSNKVLGPFEFKLYSLAAHSMSSLIQSETKAVIEMIP